MAEIQMRDIERVNAMLKTFSEKQDDILQTKQMEKELQRILEHSDAQGLDDFERLLESEIAWFPDSELGYGDMHKYGYFDNLMLPVGKERAEELFHNDMEIFALYPDGTEALLESIDEIREFDGMYGVEKDAWQEYLMPDNLREDMEYTYEPKIPVDRNMAREMFQARFAVYLVDSTIRSPQAETIDDIEKNDIFQVRQDDYLIYVKGMRMMEQSQDIASMEEFHMIFADHDCYGIYQLKESDKTRSYQFMDYEFTQRQGIQIERGDYELVYSGELYPADTLEGMYERFNIDHPKDFRAHSLSVSDVVVFQREGQVSAHYVDSFGYRELPDFLLSREQIEANLNRNDISRRRDRSPLAKVEEQLEQNYNMVDDVLNNGVEQQNMVGRIDYYGTDGTIQDSQQFSSEEELIKQAKEQAYYGVPMAIALYKDQDGKTISREFISELDPPPKEISIEDEPTVKEVEKEKTSKATLTFYAAVCEEFHDMGEYKEFDTLEEAVEKYKLIRDDPRNGYMGNGMGFILHDPEETTYSEMPYPLVQGDEICGDQLDLVRAFVTNPLILDALKQVREMLPDYSYTPPSDLREDLYPLNMSSQEIGEAMVNIAREYEPYEFMDVTADMTEDELVMDVVQDLYMLKKGDMINYLKDIIDDEHELAPNAKVLIDRIKNYKPDFNPEMTPVVIVLYSQDKERIGKTFYSLDEFEKLTAKQDKEIFLMNQKTEGLEGLAYRVSVEIRYPEDDAMKSVKAEMHMGNGYGGILESNDQVITDRLHDESWIKFQQSRGEDYFNSLIQDMSDWQEHVLPHLQQFCTLPEVVPAKQAERSTIADKPDRSEGNASPNKIERAEKLSIHKRLEINKAIVKKQPEKDKDVKNIERV